MIGLHHGRRPTHPRQNLPRSTKPRGPIERARSPHEKTQDLSQVERGEVGAGGDLHDVIGEDEVGVLQAARLWPEEKSASLGLAESLGL